MKVFIISTTANITSKDIQDFIWMNVDGEFQMTVSEVSGVSSPEVNKTNRK